jgi:hypothetical protein
MLALRYAAVVAAALWVGGLIILGAVAAPAIFDTIAQRSVADGRVLAGAIFGEAFRRFHFIAYGCAAVIILSLVARAALGPRPVRLASRLTIALVMLIASLYSGMVLSGRIEQLRIESGGAPSSLAEGDPRRTAFGRLHALSTFVQIVPIAGGLVLLFRELTDS